MRLRHLRKTLTSNPCPKCSTELITLVAATYILHYCPARHYEKIEANLNAPLPEEQDINAREKLVRATIEWADAQLGTAKPPPKWTEAQLLLAEEGRTSTWEIFVKAHRQYKARVMSFVRKRKARLEEQI